MEDRRFEFLEKNPEYNKRWDEEIERFERGEIHFSMKEWMRTLGVDEFIHLQGKVVLLNYESWWCVILTDKNTLIKRNIDDIKFIDNEENSQT